MTRAKPFVARSGTATTMDESFIDASAGLLDIKRDLSLQSSSLGSPDYPAFDVGAVEEREGSFIASDECLAGSISLDNSIPRELRFVTAFTQEKFTIVEKYQIGIMQHKRQKEVTLQER